MMTDEKQSELRDFDGVKIEYPSSFGSLPLVVVSSQNDYIGFRQWVRSHSKLINQILCQFGSMLFRNFNIRKIDDFKDFIQLVSQSNLLEYLNQSTPRTHLGSNIYTSTEYPAMRFIPLHNENSYSSSWPSKIAFFCIQPAESGGETPLADSRRVFNRIKPTVKESFSEKKVMYVRNYGDIDIPWQKVFDTKSKAEVESYCIREGIKFEWKGNSKLKTSQVLPAIKRHPLTGEEVWFNQAHLFHISSQPPEMQKSLLEIYSEEDLPRNAYFGDGTQIENCILEEIQEIYRQETYSFSWQANDVLLLDNLLCAHGRMPFSGKREVLVGMT
jgi:alpha-ketoglutarate-dependent taurine dioxygenase